MEGCANSILPAIFSRIQKTIQSTIFHNRGDLNASTKKTKFGEHISSIPPPPCTARPPPTVSNFLREYGKSSSFSSPFFCFLLPEPLFLNTRVTVGVPPSVPPPPSVRLLLTTYLPYFLSPPFRTSKLASKARQRRRGAVADEEKRFLFHFPDFTIPPPFFFEKKVLKLPALKRYGELYFSGVVFYVVSNLVLWPIF